jgi:hypothetical protein
VHPSAWLLLSQEGQNANASNLFKRQHTLVRGSNCTPVLC